MRIHPTPQPFGLLASGESVEVHTLSNETGASVEILNYGGIVKSLRVPDRHGAFADVVLGFNDLDSYVAGTAYFGAITGRIAGRVRAGRIVVDGQPHVLSLNGGAYHLHGGVKGFDKRLWTVQGMTRADDAESVRLLYDSPAGEEGYPGNVRVTVTYTLSAASEFIVETEVTTDRTTPLALTHHSYFNLAGEGAGTVADHELQIFADATASGGDDLLFTGQREPVAGQVVDFRQPRCLGEALPTLPHQGHGNFYHLRQPGSGLPAEPTRAARLVEPYSGRVLEVFTDEHCLQFYAGSMLRGQPQGKFGEVYSPFSGLCLECQGFPEGTIYPQFGDIFVRPGDTQRRRTVYAFSTI